MTNINWQRVLTHAKNYMLNDLPKNVDRKIVEEYGTPFLNELNGIVGYLIEDSKKGYTLSPTTKRYISARIIPSVKQSIDSYWDSLSFIKQQTFRSFRKSKIDRIKLYIGMSFRSWAEGLHEGLQLMGNKDENLFVVVGQLMLELGHNSPFEIAITHKLESI